MVESPHSLVIIHLSLHTALLKILNSYNCSRQENRKSHTAFGDIQRLFKMLKSCTEAIGMFFLQVLSGVFYPLHSAVSNQLPALVRLLTGVTMLLW